MAIEFIKEKPLSEVKEKEEMKKVEVQADVFEVIANLYEDMEKLKARVEQLEGGVKQ